jgi:hypothetical protein
MSERKLKLWNGNAQTFVPYKLAREKGLRHNSYVHMYACAASRADLCRMIAEWTDAASRSLNGYIRDYWSEGAWGDSMTGITPERGLWIAFDYGSKPKKVWPAEG